MTGFLIALLSGALMSVQGVFNTQVTKTTGLWVSNGWVQASALAACVAVWFFAGVIGAGITWTVVKSMEQLGPAKAALLIVIAQLIVAYLIELFGLFGVEREPLEWRRVIGMGIALIGVAIFQWK